MVWYTRLYIYMAPRHGACAHDKWAVRVKVKRRGHIMHREDEQADQNCDRLLCPAPIGGFSSNPTDV